MARDIPVTRRVVPDHAERKYDVGRCHAHYWRKRILVVDAFDLLVASAANRAFIARRLHSSRVSA
jgi:hypothetical protein